MGLGRMLIHPALFICMTLPCDEIRIDVGFMSERELDLILLALQAYRPHTPEMRALTFSLGRLLNDNRSS